MKADAEVATGRACGGYGARGRDGKGRDKGTGCDDAIDARARPRGPGRLSGVPLSLSAMST